MKRFQWQPDRKTDDRSSLPEPFGAKLRIFDFRASVEEILLIAHDLAVVTKALDGLENSGESEVPRTTAWPLRKSTVASLTPGNSHKAV